MELNSTSIHDVIHPTAAFSRRWPGAKRHPAMTATGPSSWLESQLNPKNRIDSLDPPQNPMWRIDGCTGLGTQYYALPVFLGHVPPMRFDVFIPEEAAASPILRKLLDLDAAFHTKDAVRVRRLGISRHILRTLQAWTAEKGGGDGVSVEDMYRTLPFGSRIIFENLDANIRNIKITVAPTYYIEKQLLGLAKLDVNLGLAPEILPRAIDISCLDIVQQLHDSVCVVSIQQSVGVGDTGRDRPAMHAEDKLWVFKALTSATKYLYTELRNLLRMEPHPHVIPRPEYLVTKYCRFGGKTAVVGFLEPYHAKGSLRDALPLLRVHGRLTLQTQLKWATQLASALLHVRERGRIFYPDLRLDNIVLSAADDVVMVDFEQRGVWCEFAAPEVNALEYARILASDGPADVGYYSREEDGEEEQEEEEGPAAPATTTTIPEEVRAHFAAILSRLLPGWEALQASDEYTQAPPPPPGPEGGSPHGDHHHHQHHGCYNIPWLCLDAAEQEAAEVYMLGRVLWCVFEGQSAPHPAAVWQSYRREPDLEFPAFSSRTPPPLRDLIDRCTRGRRPTLSGLIVRRGSKLVLRDGKKGEEGNGGGGSPEDEEGGNEEDEVRAAARAWWREEVAAAERFLEMREERRNRGEWDGNYYARPRLREVLAELERFRDGVALSSS